MRMKFLACAALLSSCLAEPTCAATITVNASGDAGAGNCASTCTLRDAIASAGPGDTIVFANGLVSPITLTQGELLLDKALTISGPGAGKLTISAGNASRLFNMAANVTVQDLSLADGFVAGNGGAGGGFPGAAGGSGGSVGGACMLIANGFAAVIDRVSLRNCRAIGGGGGGGAAGLPAPPTPPMPGGTGGRGGAGGNAMGAAILSYGSLSLVDSSITDAHAIGGAGGLGGIGGFGTPFGVGGLGGDGGPAIGGALAIGNGGSLRIFNSTIANSSSQGGNGGNGASGGIPGLGGNGGTAAGGLLNLLNGVALADLEFSTLSNGSVAAGADGNNGRDGTGISNGSAISASSTLNVLSSIVVGTQGGTSLCSGTVSASPGSANLDEDASCGFSIQASFAQTLRALDASATPAFLPAWNSPAIDAAANCQDLESQTVAADQHGTSRPQGAQCDLGAIEADYLFVDGFDNE